MGLAACAGHKTVSVRFPDGFTVQARVADTPEKAARGLMFVKQLPENEGMLFLFDREEMQAFWMKNTWIDLDIIFLNADGKINRIFDRVEHTHVYTPDAEIPVVQAPAHYVLELAAGTAARHQLQAGNKLEWNL